MEMRITLRNVGKIDPRSIDDYIQAGGYKALEKARGTDPAVLIEEVERSGRLRGRGGAGFNTGLKWRGAMEAPAGQKYVICNADEGEPGTYKDRIILENDPHSILEGMLICAYVVGATEGYIYCRGEYREANEILKLAIKQAEKKDLTGGVRFHVASGAGSYVCGEETALIESLEGKRGEPRVKPPYPTVEGFRGMPTVVNNVETFATIPSIVEKGAEWFKGIGMPGYPGTKIFSLSGDVVNKTFFEVPTDTTLRDIVYGLGGGIPNGRRLKAVQVGGSSCGFLTSDMLDTPIDYDSMAQRGAALGSGSVLVIDDSHSILGILLSIARFFEHESCGKCVPCREGSMRMAELMDKIAGGNATRKDLDMVKSLAGYMQKSCFCPLGQSASVAISGAIDLYPDDFASVLKSEEVRNCEACQRSY